MTVAEKKIKLAQWLFRHIFAVPTRDQLTEKKVENMVFRPASGKSGLRGFWGKAFGEDISIYEQNRDKISWCGELAKAGHKCAWLFKGGKYSAFLIEMDGVVKIIHESKAKATVTGWFRKAESQVLDEVRNEGLEAAVNDIFGNLSAAEQNQKAALAKARALMDGTASPSINTEVSIEELPEISIEGAPETETLME